MSRSGQYRRKARHAGVLQADGGDDTRAYWDGRGYAESYDAGYREHGEHLEREAALSEAPDAETIIRDLLEAINSLDTEGVVAESEATMRARTFLGDRS